MIDSEKAGEMDSNRLCKACGLCCTGHLFAWTKLRSAELDHMEPLGVEVVRSVPSQRGFNQPCPLWQETCTIYTSAHYPHFCRVYKCKLLKSLLEGTISLEQGLSTVQQTKRMIEELEVLLPPTEAISFRERVVAYLETPPDPRSAGGEEATAALRKKTEALVIRYGTVFGVKDLVDPLSL